MEVLYLCYRMKKTPKIITQKIEQRIEKNALRSLHTKNELVDFSSNDYLGFSKSATIFEGAHRYLTEYNLQENGATGSRLLSGNHQLYDTVETMLCDFHESEAAIIFNSGYDANIGFFSSVPQRGDVILYDEFIHASIRDGATMSNAKSYKFKHNDISHLEEMLKRFQQDGTIYVVTESVFSMDGDTPDLKAMATLCKTFGAFIIVDEAHAVGVFGASGYGALQQLEIQHEVFARIVTFGKALGCHGAAILGSRKLKQYLVNFARSLIYTTALPPHSLATIREAYNAMKNDDERTSNVEKLHQNITYFKTQLTLHKLQNRFIESNSAIHSCIIKGTKNVKLIALKLQEKGFDVKPILAPTVPKGQERLRFCLHAYNSEQEMKDVASLLSTFVQ